METSVESEASEPAMDTSAVAETTSGEDTLLETSSIAETEQSMNESTSESTVVKKRKRGRQPLQQSSRKKARSSTGAAAATKKSSDGLYDIVLAGKSALQSVASEWVDRYHDDQETAMLELVQYFVHCSGCKATITAHMFTQEASTVIRSLTENFAEESVEYPLVSGGVQAKKFKANFSELMERLVDQCQHSVLCDEYMLDTLVMWLVGLTDSPVRAFRHTCTLACLKLTTAVVHVATKISTELDSTQRQADAERRRSASQRVSGKLQKLDRKLTQLEGQLKDLQEVMNTIFSSVFVHRYRDNRPEIRALCIAELGIWMREYGVVYLNDHYLKYIGWTLYDKSAEVRAQSVISLQPLYSTPELFPHLELFTRKFKDRIVSMRLDKEETVAVNAIALCSYFLTLDMLEEEDCVEICELVFMETRVAHAAGNFAVQYLFSEDFMSKTHQSLAKRGRKKVTDAQIMLKEIVHFFIDASVHHHAVYLVDSLWDHAPVLKDWEAMIELLLDSSCVIELTAVEEKALIEVMTCAVKKAAAGGVKGKGKAVSVKERRIIEQDREEIATKLIPCLPDLISKYGAEPDCAINLSAIPQHFDLEVYVQLRAQKHLENLLVHLKDLVMKHNVPEVLYECSRTFSHLLDADFSLHSTVSVQFGELCDELFTSCHTLVGVVSEDGMTDEENEDVSNLSVVLKRIAEFYKSIDLTQWQFSDDIMVLLDAAVDANCSDLLAVPAISCLRMHVLWVLISIDEDDPNREALRTLRNIAHHVINQNVELVRYSGRPAVQREAFSALCDLLILFSTQLHNHGGLGSLVYTPDQALQSSMCEYVMQCVIGEEEEEEPVTEDQVLSQAESLNDRRILLAGFLKLIMYCVFDTTVAAPVFANYVKKFHSYGDLIKMAVTRSRESNPMSWYRTVLLSLQQLYNTLLEDRVVVDYQSPDWADIKDLAHRYVLTLGFDPLRYRQPLVGIHRDGIKFALSHDDSEEIGDDVTPSNLPFLDILAEFSIRLLQVDRTGSKGVLPYLKEQLGEGVLERVEEKEGWEPLHRYVVSIVGEDKTAPANTSRVIGKKRAKNTKRKGPAEEGSPSSKTVRVEE